MDSSALVQSLKKDLQRKEEDYEDLKKKFSDAKKQIQQVQKEVCSRRIVFPNFDVTLARSERMVTICRQKSLPAIYRLDWDLNESRLNFLYFKQLYNIYCHIWL